MYIYNTDTYISTHMWKVFLVILKVDAYTHTHIYPYTHMPQTHIGPDMARTG